MARSVHAAIAPPAAGPILQADTPAASIAILSGAIAFHLFGSALLAAGAPPLAALHAFAAFVVIAVVATTHQLLPVLLRVPPVPWMQTIAIAGGFAAGFALLIAGFLGLPTFALAGTLLLISAAFWFVLIAARALRAPSERRTALAIALAALSFIAAACIGAWMAYDFAAQHAPGQSLAGLHGVLMVAAFASVLIVAISYRFVPMFSLSHADAYGSRAVQWVFFAGAILSAVFHTRWSALPMLFALCALVYQHIRTLQRRLRKRMDPSLIYASAAWGFALLAAATAVLRGITPATAVALAALSVLGWLSLTIFGYGLKICGFLSWQIAKQRDADAPLAPLSSAIPVKAAYIALALLSGGVLLLAANGARWGAVAQAGCYLYLLGGLAYVLTFASVAKPYLFPTVRTIQ